MGRGRKHRNPVKEKQQVIDIPEKGDFVVFLTLPKAPSKWKLPPIGTVLIATRIRTNVGGAYPVHIYVKDLLFGPSNYSNVLIPEFLEPLNTARNKVIVGDRRKTRNCCWTCKHFHLPTCETRRNVSKTHCVGCSKLLSSSPKGHLSCSGSESRKGCGVSVAYGRRCWEPFFLNAGKLKGAGTFQRNLIFPRCPS